MQHRKTDDSSDPTFRQSADLGKLGSPEAKSFSVLPKIFRSCFLFLRSSVASEKQGTCFFLEKIQFLRSRVFEGFASEELSCSFLFSPLPLFSLRFRTSFWILRPRFVERNMSKIVAFYLKSANSSCHEIRSSGTSVGRFPVPVLGDLISWHEELPD